jgi:hypothetical protein
LDFIQLLVELAGAVRFSLWLALDKGEHIRDGDNIIASNAHGCQGIDMMGYPS